VAEMLYTVAYQYGTYSGEEKINAETEEEAIQKLWRRLKPYMTLPMAYKSAKIIK
jgi:hypothetical protein